MIRVADYIMNRLYLENIKHIFMVTGRGALFLTDAIAKHKNLVGISVHHEQAGAYASVAYAQYNDKLGACLVSSGCAGTNTLTGVLSAWQDGIPCIFISGQNKLHETSHYTGVPVRTYGQQEADIIPIVKPITKHATMITKPDNIVFEMEKALYLAQTGRKGPVWLDIPLDIQNMRVEVEKLTHFKPKKNLLSKFLQQDIQYIQKAINCSERPVILIGSGIRNAGAIDIFDTFIKKLSIPVVYTGSAPDTFGTDNLLSIGSVGIMGCSRAGNFALQNSDLLLVLGCRLSSMTTSTDYINFVRDAKTIVVDIDPIEHTKNTIKIDRLVINNAKTILTMLTKSEIKETNFTWRKKCIHWKNLFPVCEDKHKTSKEVDLYYLADCLSKVLPKKSVFVSDSGLVELILPTNILFKKGQRCIHPSSQGAMGYALPAAVGSYYASGIPVIAVIGDGSIMMNLQELETIRYHNIPVKIFVINNNVYAVIRKRQSELFRSRTIGTDSANGIDCPSFKKVAECFDIPYRKIENSSKLQQHIKSIIDMNGPVICEIIGLENQEYIQISHARNSQGKFVTRPIEDQAPFIDRGLFLSEMIIKPLD